MSYNDSVSDFVVRIRNAYLAGSCYTKVRLTKMNLDMLRILQQNCYINDFDEKDRYDIRVCLRYNQSGVSAINAIHRISKPGCRRYSCVKDLKKFYNGYAICVLSTPKGVMSDVDARKYNVGGELLYYVF